MTEFNNYFVNTTIRIGERTFNDKLLVKAESDSMASIIGIIAQASQPDRLQWDDEDLRSATEYTDDFAFSALNVRDVTDEEFVVMVRHLTVINQEDQQDILNHILPGQAISP